MFTDTYRDDTDKTIGGCLFSSSYLLLTAIASPNVS